MSRADQRNQKRLHLKMFQVQRRMFRVGADGLEQVETEGLSPFFGSRFAAVKALRKIRKTHPTAALEESIVPFDNPEYAIFKLFVVRAGERPWH